MQGPHLKKCPSCGGHVEQLISPPAIQFKGSGWYVTDYARSSGGDKGDHGGPGDKSENKSEHKGDSKTDSKTESKPASEGKEKKKAGKEK